MSGTGQRRAEAATRWLVVVPTLLVLVAEAAWTSVVAGLLGAFALRGPALGMAVMLVIVVAGALAARRLAPRLGERWPMVAVGLAIGVGAIGWLAAPEVRAVLGAQGASGIGEALLVNPGGWVAAVAFVRGIAQHRVPPDPHAVTTLLGLAVPGLAAAALLGGMVAEPSRSRFLADAAGAVLVFVVAGILALALGRLTAVGTGSGVDWRRNPAWVGLLVLLLGGVALAAVSASVVVGPVIVTVLGAMVPSLLLIGLVVGFDRRSLRILAMCLMAALLVATVLRAIGARPSPAVAIPGTGVTSSGDPAAATPIAVAFAVVLLVVAVVVTLVLARYWMRRPRAPEDDLEEVRWIDHGEIAEQARRRRGRRGLRFGRPAPADAVAAYRMLIEDLAPRPRVRREPGETPAEHAARLRRSGIGSISLDLLAADYGLVRFAGRPLSSAEERRAVGRFARLRRSLTEGARIGASIPGAGPEREQERPGDAAMPGEGPGSRSRFRVG